MALEDLTGTTKYINALVATNPDGAVDPKSEGDDHLRGIKNTIKNTFPSITGPVTATQTELNIMDGVTSSAAELNILDGVTATTAEINKLAGVGSASLLKAMTDSGSVSLAAGASTTVAVTHGLGTDTIGVQVSAFISGSTGVDVVAFCARDAGGYLHPGRIRDADSNPALAVPSAGQVNIYLKNTQTSTQTVYWRAYIWKL